MSSSETISWHRPSVIAKGRYLSLIHTVSFCSEISFKIGCSCTIFAAYSFNAIRISSLSFSCKIHNHCYCFTPGVKYYFSYILLYLTFVKFQCTVCKIFFIDFCTKRLYLSRFFLFYGFFYYFYLFKPYPC